MTAAANSRAAAALPLRVSAFAQTEGVRTMRDQHVEARPAARRRFPPRPVGRFEPLMTASEAYPALEREALAAEKSIWLFFRIFDPNTRLRDPKARAAAGETWFDLLRLKAEQGVQLRIAISDFDAHAAPELHESAWSSARALGPLLEAGDVEVLVATHEARAGRVFRVILLCAALLATEKRRRMLNGLERLDGARRHSDGPGFWSALRSAKEGGLAWRGPPQVAARPATHHQKLAVFDAKRCVMGGLDLNPRRWDTPDHDRPAQTTWRDLNVLLDGPIAADAARHLAECWNRDAPRAGREMADRATYAPVDAPRFAPPNALTPPEAPAATRGAAPFIRLLRTLSIRRRGPLTLAPGNVAHELEAGYLTLIREAKRLLYVETQFLRSRRIGKALRRAGKRKPELRLIIVLPAAPERAAFEKSRSPSTRFGEWLQARTLRKVQEVFGRRCVVISPARPAPRREQDRSALHGAGIIYVHTKAMVADDRVAIVSSANLNGRSLRWDTEVGVLVRDPTAAARLRRRLFETLLPKDAPEAAYAFETAPEMWARIAEDNASRPPVERRGLILRHDVSAAEALGAPLPGAPEELV